MLYTVSLYSPSMLYTHDLRPKPLIKIVIGSLFFQLFWKPPLKVAYLSRNSVILDIFIILPNSTKWQNICSKMWPIGQLYIELGPRPYCHNIYTLQGARNSPVYHCHFDTFDSFGGCMECQPSFGSQNSHGGGWGCYLSQPSTTHSKVRTKVF